MLTAACNKTGLRSATATFSHALVALPTHSLQMEMGIRNNRLPVRPGCLVKWWRSLGRLLVACKCSCRFGGLELANEQSLNAIRFKSTRPIHRSTPLQMLLSANAVNLCTSLTSISSAESVLLRMCMEAVEFLFVSPLRSACPCFAQGADRYGPT